MVPRSRPSRRSSMDTLGGSDEIAAERLSRGLLLTLAAATGLAVANIYYNQPMLGLIEASLGPGAATSVPVLTQLGYASGLFLLTPLGDVTRRKQLIVAEFVLLAIALVLAGAAPDALTLAIASALVGFAASVAQQLVPLTAELAQPQRRGAAIGAVMSGLLLGVLLSRTLAGFVAAQFGWRTMFLAASPTMLLVALALQAILPDVRGELRLPYPELMGSLRRLWRDLAALRRAAFTQAFLFAAFSAFWTVLALRLAAPPLGLGAGSAGLFGVVGTIGVIAAPLAGRLADARGPSTIVRLGAALALASWAGMALWSDLAGLVAGVLALDLAMQAALVSNQHVIYALRADARGRLNTLFMTTMFLGGAGGSFSAMIAWRLGEWPAVAVLGMAFSAAALAIQLRAPPRPSLSREAGSETR